MGQVLPHLLTVTHICNLSSLEVEGRGSEVQGHPSWSLDPVSEGWGDGGGGGGERTWKEKHGVRQHPNMGEIDQTEDGERPLCRTGLNLNGTRS